MILGTGSHVGKSTLTAALCRIISDDGYSVAPFKAQNMSLNSAATPDGREIGRAQALQAEAARVVPRAEMNPVLIKPSSDISSQVVVMGRVWGQVDASDYYRQRVEELFPLVVDCFRRLSAAHDVVVLEGAGSPAEINLKSRDIVNMRMAMAAEAACLLTVDIDRGGAFASLVGTMVLLDETERQYIRGFIINKFRGDLSLLTPGIRMMEERLQIPCAGVIPFLPSLGLDEEDGVSLEDRRTSKLWKNDLHRDDPERPLRIAVVALPHLSNFTDFDPLIAEPEASLIFIEKAEDIQFADVVIIPGSKQTLSDLDWLRQKRFENALASWRFSKQSSSTLIGVCGGLQMLGHSIDDLAGEGGDPAFASGLALLPIRTTLQDEKVTRRAFGILSAKISDDLPSGAAVSGYEIHLGTTLYLQGAKPFASILREGCKEFIEDGAISEDGTVFGTYLHGLFDDDGFRHAFLRAMRRKCGLAAPLTLANVQAERDGRINRLAREVRASLDMPLIYGLLRLQCESEKVTAHAAV